MSATGIPFYTVPIKVIDFSNTRLSVALGKNQFGGPQPNLDVFLPPDRTYHRELSALLLTCAAILELNTPPSERWRIQTNYLRGHNHRLVFLDLAKGDHAEALRGMMLLNTMLG